METKKIKCKCGQENELVLIGDKWRYNIKRHGSSAEADGKCFNCFADLPGMKQNKEPAAETVAEEVDIHSLKKAELVSYAIDLGIDLPAKSTKAEIIALIEEKAAELAAIETE